MTLRYRHAAALCAAMGVMAWAGRANAAGACVNTKEAKAMEKLMMAASTLVQKGEFKEALDKLQEAQAMGVCPDLAKKCAKQVQEMVQEAKEVMDAAKKLCKDRKAEKEDVIDCLCKLYELQLGWRGHPIGAAAGKEFKQLLSKKRRLLKQDIKEADKAVKEQVKEAAGFLRKRDYRSALVCYDRIFSKYPYSKRAGRCLRTYLALKEKVKELDKEEQAAKQKR